MRAGAERWLDFEDADEYADVDAFADVDTFEDIDAFLEEEFGLEGDEALTARQRTSAVRANRLLSRQIGWGLSRAAGIDIIPQLRAALGLGAAPTDDQLADAIAARQVALGLRETGQLDNRTWAQIRPGLALPATSFRAFRLNITHAGRQIGILEKVAPLRRVIVGPRRGVEIQLGFRATNMTNLQRSGFVLGNGDPNVRFIQLVQFLRQVATTGGVIAHITQTDPVAALGVPTDAHPYYRNGQIGDPSPGGAAAGFHISSAINQQAPNGLMYDNVFFDSPSTAQVPAAGAPRLVRRLETAVAGVRPGNRNTLLQTISWGFDVVRGRGGVIELREAAIIPGPTGGSALMRRLLARAAFPGHCFVGGGFPRAARCA